MSRPWWTGALDQPLSRRRLVGLASRGAVVGAAVALGVSRGLPRLLRAEDVEGGWITRWRLEQERFGDGRLTGLFVGDDGALRVSSGRRDGTYVSRTTSTTRPFSVMGANFSVDDHAVHNVTFEARVSDDAESWSGWTVLPFDHAYARGKTEGEDEPSTEPLLEAGRYFQLRITLRAGTRLRRAEVVAIGVPEAPGIDQVTARARNRLGIAKDAPVPVLSRADWGATEAWRFNSSGAEIWPPAYVPVTKFLVHHTVTSNSQSGLSQLRAVYAYHSLSRGWGDIGYNYLIDSNGNIYEGRAGGGNVVGGHALLFNWGSIGIGTLGNFADSSEAPGGMHPTAAMLAAIERFIARRCFDRDMDPEGHGVFWNYDIPNIIGHRDANNKCEGCSTGCPGNYMYAQLPNIRKVAGGVGRPRQAALWLEHTVQGDYYSRQRTAEVKILAKNTGGESWRPEGSDAMRIVARWETLRFDEYRDDGNLTTSAPVPDEVKAGREAYLPITLKLPKEVGQYHLVFTLQQDGSPSMAATGHATLDMRVNIRSQMPFSVPASVRMLVEAGAVEQLPIAIDGDGQPWTATSDNDAVRVVPAEGSAPNTAAIRVDASALEEGTYDVAIRFEYLDATGQGGVATIALNLVVKPKVRRTFFPATRT